MSNKQVRVCRFERGAAAIQTLYGDVGRYGCPLCMNPYTLQGAESGEGLTLDHAPPQCIGGRLGVLVCAQCNHRAGRQFERDAAARERTEDFRHALRGHGSYTGWAVLRVGDLMVNAELRFGPKGNQVRIPRKRNHPNVHGVLDEWAKVQRMPDEVKVTLRDRYRSWAADVTLLKAAFLVAFAQFGYEYAYNERLVQVREQILNPKRQRLRAAFISPSRDIVGENCFILVRAPFPMLVVNFKRRSVLLPWVHSPANFYEELTAKRGPDLTTPLVLTGSAREPFPREPIYELEGCAAPVGNLAA